jgi:hypothetical protein
MTIDEKLQHVESALKKIRDTRQGWHSRLDLDLTQQEFDVIEAGLEIAASICTLFKAREQT